MPTGPRYDNNIKFDIVVRLRYWVRYGTQDGKLFSQYLLGKYARWRMI